MKIFIPVIGFVPAGGYRVLSKLADEWINLGHKVTFISTEWSSSPYFSTKANIIWVNEKGESVKKEKGSQFLGTFRFIRTLKSLYHGLRKHAKDADVIVANHNATVWPVAFFPSSAKKIYYVQAYEPEYYHYSDIKSKIYKFISYLSYFIIKDKIVNSPIYLNYKNLKSNKFVPPGLDFNIFYPKNIKNANKIWIIGCIGRKEPEKGTKYVIDAFEKMIALGWPVKLHVAYGNVPLSISCREDCQIIDPKNDQDLGDFYRGLDIMIAPGTLQLGAPHYPVLEAMACGVPVVTTGYMPADDTNSWLVPLKGSDSIVEAVKNIINMDESARNKKIQKAYEDVQEFSWPLVAEKFIKYL